MPHAGGARGYGAMRRETSRPTAMPHAWCARALPMAPYPAPCRARGAVWCRGSAAVGGTGRRALHGPGAPAGGRGRTETLPAKLSACATCHAHGALPGAMPHAQNSHDYGARALLGRRDGDIAPYRHYPRKIRTPLHTAHYPVPCRTRKIRTTTGHAHYPTPCRTRIARGGSPSRAARVGRFGGYGGYKPLKCQPKSL